jgi:hypothetical protein
MKEVGSDTARNVQSTDVAGAADIAPTERESGPHTVDTSTTAQEQSMSLPEVHPFHAAPRTWRDFFIHIATIVIGLLIASGLEQAVEYVHHCDQLQQARRELSVELQANRRVLEENLAWTRKLSLELDADIVLLRAQQSSRTPVAKDLRYTWSPSHTLDGAWQAVKQNGSLSLMPHDELQRYVYFYEVLAAFMDALPVFGTRLEVAGAIARRSPDGSFSSREIEELMSATSEAQGHLALLSRLLSYAQEDLKQASP